MKDIPVIVAIVIYIVSAVIKASRSMKTPPSTTITPTVEGGRPIGLPKGRVAVPGQSQQPAGNVGKTLQTRGLDKNRAMNAAAPRLADGAQYADIVADRNADLAGEQRFTKEVDELIASEPKYTRQQRTTRVEAPSAPPAQVLGKIGQFENRNALVNAVILAELLGAPRCHSNRRR
jgi:hypothetical protein